MALYSTKVVTSGGRHGMIRSEDGLLDLRLALPKSLGGRGDATNPEQLFGGGYGACFENALFHVAMRAINLQTTTSRSSLRSASTKNAEGSFVLSAALAVTIAGVDLETAQKLVDGAHHICPYSNAIRGNVDVKTSVSIR